MSEFRFSSLFFSLRVLSFSFFQPRINYANSWQPIAAANNNNMDCMYVSLCLRIYNPKQVDSGLKQTEMENKPSQPGQISRKNDMY